MTEDEDKLARYFTVNEISPFTFTFILYSQTKTDGVADAMT